MLKLGAISLQRGVWASLLQLSASVLFKSLTKLPGISEDAQLSYTPELGDFQVTSILCWAVFNADTVQSHWGGWAKPILWKIIPTSVSCGESGAVCSVPQVSRRGDPLAAL